MRLSAGASGDFVAAAAPNAAALLGGHDAVPSTPLPYASGKSKRGSFTDLFAAAVTQAEAEASSPQLFRPSSKSDSGGSGSPTRGGTASESNGATNGRRKRSVDFSRVLSTRRLSSAWDGRGRDPDASKDSSSKDSSKLGSSKLGSSKDGGSFDNSKAGSGAGSAAGWFGFSCGVEALASWAGNPTSPNVRTRLLANAGTRTESRRPSSSRHNSMREAIQDMKEHATHEVRPARVIKWKELDTNMEYLGQGGFRPQPPMPSAMISPCGPDDVALMAWP